MLFTADTLSPRPRGFSNLVNITRVLAWTDFKQRYAGSALGYLWSVSKPLLLFSVLYVVFTHIFRFGAGIDHYPAMLLFAIVLWTYFTEVTGGAVTVLVGRADVLRKIALPRIALPLSIAVTGGMVMVFNLVAVAIFVVINDVEPSWSWLLLLPLMIELVVFTIGVSLLLSVYYVSLRDIGQVWDLVLQMMFYATPIIYPITLAAPALQKFLLISPMAQIVQQSREALVGTGQVGQYGEIMQGIWYFVPYAIVVLVVGTGAYAFARTAPTVAERL